jgi:hypothetical protein
MTSKNLSMSYYSQTSKSKKEEKILKAARKRQVTYKDKSEKEFQDGG